MNQRIRKATIADIHLIETCAREAYAIYIERIGREDLPPMVADFSAQGDHIHLENVVVQAQHKGRRLGSKLIAFVEEQARKRGLAAVELYTNEKMSENLKMYPKLGYVETDRRTEDELNRVFFRKAV